MKLEFIIDRAVKALASSAIILTVMPTNLTYSETIADQKRALRKLMVERRDALTPSRRAQYSATITTQLLTMAAYQQAKTVMAYMSFGSEFDTSRFVEQVLREGKKLALPRVDKINHALVIHQIDNVNDVEVGVFSIREPRADAPLIDLSEIDFMLMPGLAFDRTGMRMGYGAGFYDQLLVRIPAVKNAQTPVSTRVSAVFAMQMVEAVPCTEHDQRIHFIITENEQIKI